MTPRAALKNGLWAMPSSRLYVLGVLWLAFIACLVVRLWYPFYNNPLHHVFSDPLRHWVNGMQFTWPNAMGSIDPMGYQVWLGALQRLDGGTSHVILAATAVLSAALPLLWYLALIELLPAAWALVAATVIGFTPSLFLIYSYFMTDTLLLTLSAAGFWLTLRGMRTRHPVVIVAVALVWALAAYTRLVGLPLAVLCFAVLALSLSWKMRAVLAVAISASFAMLAIPACWHSSKNLNFCAPFGLDYLGAVYRASSAKSMRLIVLSKGDWTFSSPSMYNKPLAPLSEWQSSRMGTHVMAIDPANGRDDWKRILRSYQEDGPSLPWLTDKLENAAMLFFDPSWPDNDDRYWWGRLTIWSRWLWLPLTVAVGLLILKVRPGIRDGLIPFSAVALMGMLLVQTTAIMEGRYRKPAEPLLIAGAFVLSHRLRNDRRARVVVRASARRAAVPQDTVPASQS